MNDITLNQFGLSQSDIKQASIEQLKVELSRSLKLTSEYLVYMAMIWSELNSRGEDLSALKSGLFEYIPLIAVNQLDASLVIEFAGNKTLLSCLARLPIEQQKEIAQSKSVPFIELSDKGGKIEKKLDLATAKANQIYQVFGGEYGFRDPDQQYMLLKAKTKAQRPAKPKRKTIRTIEFDSSREYMLIGDKQVKVETLLTALGELYEINMFNVLSNYSIKISNHKK